MKELKKELSQKGLIGVFVTKAAAIAERDRLLERGKCDDPAETGEFPISNHTHEQLVLANV